MSGGATVQVTRRDNAVWIGLNRPDKRNALDMATSQALFDLVAQGLLYESDDVASRMKAFGEKRRTR